MSEMREDFSEYFSERDIFLMREAMSAGSCYESLEGWLSEIIADGGYIVAQHLSHDANKKKAARAQGDAEPVLSKYQPCGCVICTCESDERCLGCGAVHCGSHPVSDIPNPIYTRPPSAGVPEAEMFWDADDAELFGGSTPDEFADHMGIDLSEGDSLLVNVQSAIKLPNRCMRIWVGGDDEIQWEWAQQPVQEQGK